MAAILERTEALLAAHSGLQAWHAFVELVDGTPPAEVEPHLSALAERWLQETSTWPASDLRVHNPESWVALWLEGSAFHAALLELVPRKDSSGWHPLRRHTYYKLTYYKSPSEEWGASIEMVGFFTDRRAVVALMRNAAREQHHCLETHSQEEIDAMEVRPYDAMILDIVWRGVPAGGQRFSQSITVELLEDDAFVDQLVPPLGTRELLPPSSSDPRFHPIRAHLFYEIPEDILEEVFDCSMFTMPPRHAMVPRADDLAFWDGKLRTGRFTPYTLLSKMDDCVDYEPPMTEPIPLPTDFEERYEAVIREVATEFGFIPLNPAPSLLESLPGEHEDGGPCVLPGFDVWSDDTYDVLCETPWNPAYALALNFQPFVLANPPGENLPEPLPPIGTESFWREYHHVAINLHRQNGTLSFSCYAGVDLAELPTGWGVGLGMVVCRRMRDLFRA